MLITELVDYYTLEHEPLSVVFSSFLPSTASFLPNTATFPPLALDPLSSSVVFLSDIDKYELAREDVLVRICGVDVTNDLPLV